MEKIIMGYQRHKMPLPVRNFNLPYVLTLVDESQAITTWQSSHPLAKTLRLAAREAIGVPCRWIGIRKAGVLVAEIETNWRGELSEINIHTGQLVTAINPAWMEKQI